MAITTQGYDGVAHEIDEVGWAQISDSYGSTYSVAGLDGAPDENAGRVTTVSSAERTVAVAPLIAYGHGVRDRSDSTINVQLPAVTVGLARWFLVAVRRDWQTNTTTIAALPDAQASRVIPTQRLVNPGVQDDQPLALVQITGGQSIPTAIVDLRCWSGNGGTSAASVDALAYLARLGSQVSVGSVVYQRVLNNTGSPVWSSVVPGTVEIVATKSGTQSLEPQFMTTILTASLPASAPAGLYRIDVTSATASGATTQHYIEVRWGSVILTPSVFAIDVPANATGVFPWSGVFLHGGGAATVTLSAQVNAAPANARKNTQIAISYRGAISA